VAAHELLRTVGVAGLDEVEQLGMLLGGRDEPVLLREGAQASAVR
jgi:hypothetical protein